jgi:hypothetical protein
MSRWSVVLPLVAAIALSSSAGCQVSTKPRTIAEVSPERKAAVRPAPYSGEYRLYAVLVQRGGWAQPSGEPIITERLERNAPLGFRTSSEPGQSLTAVAGERTVTLEPAGHYLWQMRADAGQVDRQKTAALVIGIAAVGITIGLLALAPWGPI